MSCRVDAGWSSCGLRSLRVENERISVEILPSLGGKIHQFVDKARDLDVLWHAPGVAPRAAPLHADFDDHWSGGWDEIFPCGLRSTNRYGDELPHMGELWTGEAAWSIVEAGPDHVEVVLSQSTPITPARWTRTLSLEAGSPVLDVAYTLENVGSAAFDFNWGLHPALEISPSTRFDIPARRGEVDDSGGDLLGRTGQVYDWPQLGSLDLRQALSPTANCFALHYLTELEDGWVAATDIARQRGFGLVFDRAVLPVVWLWLVYGGWRDYYHAILEPWTGYPSSLVQALQRGRALTLLPGEVLETRVAAIVYSGVRSVHRLERDGFVSS